MNTTIIISLIIIGLIAGLLSGVMGIGGGVVMVPLMILLLGSNQFEAQGTSLSVLAVPVTALAAYTYYQEGYVNWKYAAVIALFFVIGGFLGAKLAVNINEKVLKKIFAVLLIMLALKIIFEDQLKTMLPG
ncbi:sulfite exporter TauE/SafE family protein [Dokdonia sinensis]|uniref:Probable membrane transporter protein n=1 Tax=Dokdonia sinensis TaxID=2479847 RepID=A0A3M0G7X0_9FLAO|nr:sulfite exporter TauE/SafE family protein [Dokdonia sinensis]RMB61055.1 sulfite exporter TauE/SafE family protein [Dokdonia sinensis]